MMKAADLTASLLAPPRQFRPVSFWFLNHFLEEGELRRQIAEQDEKGFGGVMCHARDGLRTAYLEQEWEDAMRVIIDECEKRGMHVWLYDENHYPSGIAGGKIPKRFPGRTMLSLVPALEREVGTGEGIRIQGSGFGSDRENGDDRGPRGSTDRPPVSSPLLLAGLRYLLATGTRTGKTHDLLPRVHDGCLDWANDLGEPAMLLALVERGYETNPVNHPDFSFYPDYLDEEVCRGFIEETHEWYAKRFRDHFGKTIRGIFTDNACAHFGHIRRCVPWSRSLDRRFTAATGLAIEEILPKLLHPLPGYRAARLRFWRFFGDEFIRTFVGAINDWCKARRLYSTGHYCLEDGMGEHVRQIGSYFDVMRNQNLNAVDQISTRAPETSLWGIEGGEPLTACIRNTASAALFNGSPRVMCESFGCCGGWGFDLREMRRIGGHLAALGVDLFVPHGLYYSIAGTRKYECIPDHLHNPMWGYYREWSDYAARLSMLTAGSDSLAEIAVLYPVTTLQATIALGATEAVSAFRKPDGSDGDANLHAALDALPGSDRGADAERVRDLYDGLLDRLSQQHVSYEIVAEDILQGGQVGSGGTLDVPARGGKSRCRFKVIVLPGVQVLEAASLDRLGTFADQGGVVVCLGAVPSEVFDPVTGTVSSLSGPFLGGRTVVLGVGVPPAAAVAEACAWLRERQPQPIAVTGAGNALVSRAFRKDRLRYYLVHNSTDKAVADVALALRDGDEPVRLDPDHPAVERVAWQRQGDAWQTTLEMAPGQSVLFVCGLDDASRVSQSSGPPSIRPSSALRPVCGPWAFATDRDNALLLRRGKVELIRSRQIYTYTFDVDSVPSRCRLLVDLEMNLPELNAGRFCHRLSVRLNGTELRNLAPGTYLDRYIREVDATDALRVGRNELVVGIAASLREDGQRLWPPMLAGNFGARCDETGDRLIALPLEIALGDWTAQGLPDFAGEGRYRMTLAVPAGAIGRPLMLDLGDLANAVELWVDGECLGRRVAPPWQFAVPASSRDMREVEIRVINTPHNLFEAQRRPSGLFGPVTIAL
jgi:hypothetical protein